MQPPGVRRRWGGSGTPFLPLSRDDQDSRDDPLPSEESGTVGRAEASRWRFGPLPAASFGLVVGQLWFGRANSWVLYSSVSLWVIPVGVVLISVGGVMLARRVGWSRPDDGISNAEIAWVAGVVIGAVLGLAALIASF